MKQSPTTPPGKNETHTQVLTIPAIGDGPGHKIEMCRVGALIPHARNPRRITKERFDKLQEMIRRQGFRRVPYIDTHGTILCGHQSIRALINMGGRDLMIPVMIPDRELTEKEAREVMTSDNISRGEFDWDIVSADNDVEELLAMGFDEKDLDFLNTPDDDMKDDDDEMSEGGGAKTCPACGHQF